MSEDNTLDTTVDEWREEMGKLQPNDPGKTASELAKEFGSIPTSTMQSRLEKLVKAGRCIKGLGRRVNATGKVYSVSVYQLKREEKK